MFIPIFTLMIIGSYCTFSYQGGIIVCIIALLLFGIIFGSTKKQFLWGVAGICIGYISCFIQQLHQPCEKINSKEAYKISDILSLGRVVIQTNDCSFVTTMSGERGDIVTIQGYFTPYQQRYISQQIPQRNGLLDRIVGYKSANYYRSLKGISGQITTKHHQIITHDPGWFDTIKNYLSNRLTSSHLGSWAKVLAGGVLWGDRSGFESDLYQTMIQSGLVHLIAISGSNISFVLLLMLRLCKPFPVYTRYLIAGGAMIGYCLICGGDSSVIRATIMGGYSLMALMTGNKGNLYRALGVARIGMGLYNPLRITDDWGMRLSFGGAIGITMMSDYCSKFIKNQLMLWFFSTSGVTIWMWMIIARLTGYINLTTWLTGLATSPIGGILMTGSIIYTRGNQFRIIDQGRNIIANLLLGIGHITQTYGYFIDVGTPIRGCLIIILCHGVAYHYLSARSRDLSDNSI